MSRSGSLRASIAFQQNRFTGVTVAKGCVLVRNRLDNDPDALVAARFRPLPVTWGGFFSPRPRVVHKFLITWSDTQVSGAVAVPTLGLPALGVLAGLMVWLAGWQRRRQGLRC
ncbi:IPTL-CTERM sorting domain-containing protein [Halochromatium sp.]